MHESGKGQLCGTEATPNLVVPLDDQDGEIGACERDGGGEAFRAGADDDRVVIVRGQGLCLPARLEHAQLAANLFNPRSVIRCPPRCPPVLRRRSAYDQGAGHVLVTGDAALP